MFTSLSIKLSFLTLNDVTSINSLVCYSNHCVQWNVSLPFVEVPFLLFCQTHTDTCSFFFPPKWVHTHHYKLIPDRALFFSAKVCIYRAFLSLPVLRCTITTNRLHCLRIINVYCAFSLINERRDSHGIVTNFQDRNSVVSEFELQQRYNVHFRTKTIGKGINPT